MPAIADTSEFWRSGRRRRAARDHVVANRRSMPVLRLKLVNSVNVGSPSRYESTMRNGVMNVLGDDEPGTRP